MTPSEGEDSDSSDPRKILIILIFFTSSVDSFGILFCFGFPFFPSSVVVVDFTGTMKST